MTTYPQNYQVPVEGKHDHLHKTVLEKKSYKKYLHLDLKGAPPKPSYLKNLWCILKKWELSGVILEWEDCFPYKGNLEFLCNKLYSLDDAQQIIYDMQEAKLEIIPLVQTFGHLEFVLKHSVCAGHREVPIYPNSLCPSHPQSLNLISAMLEQVIVFHGGIQKLHIGADEVWHMGLCDRCKNRLLAGEAKEDLFLKHVKAVLENIKSKWPHLDLIMWDDMLRGMDESVILAYNFKGLVEPMVWHYNSAESFSLPADIWRKYSSFPSIWAAGAFKGASGGSQLVPPTAHHASNVLQWTRCLDLIKMRCRGFVLTGWSRYDHFAALCEILPCSLPSLCACLHVVSEKNFSPDTIAAVEGELKLPELAQLSKSPAVEDQALFCSWQILILTSRLMGLRHSAQAILSSEQLQTWMNDWQVANNRVNPMQLVPLVPILHNTVDEFNNIERAMKTNLSAVFDERVIEEWIETYVTILCSRVKTVLQTAEHIIAKATKSVEESHKNTEMDF